MSGRRVEVRIDRLTIQGFAPGIERRLAELLGQEIGRQLAARGGATDPATHPAPGGTAAGGHRRPLRPTDGTRRVAADVARSVVERIP